jgi:ElaA protein
MNLNDEIHWVCWHFSKISPVELHAVLALRCSVFIVEQNCPYLDPDHKDAHSYHLMGWLGNEVIAVARIVEPGISYVEVSVGRVATSSAVRGKGVGKTLMTKTMENIQEIYGKVPVRISAQSYLQKYYEGYGFVRSEKAEYLEDDIPHLDMIYLPK